ncbi:hypothetical protein ABT095_07540 [Kitasatospora sp. NPDC002227]|uniref:hypothetical protein n=1 Tax=Kitasatospora sp. NPDC002227 TaxID=3154773 RepID=UPI003322579E
MRISRSAAVVLTAVLGLTGCAALTGGLELYGKPVTLDQLTGTWTGDCDSTLVLGPGQAITVKDFPAAEEDLKITTRFSGTGSWEFEAVLQGETPTSLHVAVGTHRGVVDLAKSSHGELVLAVTVGDPDEGVGCRYTHS